MRGWTERTLNWYLAAGRLSQYPGEVLKHILPSLRSGDKVLDIGCGPGLFVLPIAPLVKEIYAMDRQPLALRTLERLAEQGGIKNIISCLGDWPQTGSVPVVDVVISAFSGSQVMVNKESIDKMLLSAGREIWLAAPGPATPPFAWLSEQDTHPNGLATIELLLRMGIPHSYQKHLLDFGQPVATHEEGRDFLSQHLRISSAQAMEHFAVIAQEKEWGWYLPNPRNLILIHIKQ